MRGIVVLLRLSLLAVVICFGVGTAAAAEITLDIERNPVRLDESFDLVFTVQGALDGDPDFTALERDFEIVSQGRSSNISIVNGDYKKAESWTLTVMAKREGELAVPAIAFGRNRSSPSAVRVLTPGTAATREAQQAEVFLEVEADPKNPYVQAQVIYTLRLLRRVSVSQASIREPEIESDEAVIVKLGEDSQYTARRNGLGYSVTERKYAIFPQKSGRLTIKPVLGEAQIVPGKGFHSPFDDYFARRPARTLRLRSQSLVLDVRPIPVAFTGKHWLPANTLELEETWGEKLSELAAGEPLTRTLTLRAGGVTVGQLPDLTASGDGVVAGAGGDLKAYPDRPVLSERQNANGVTGLRQDKTALIASKAGDYTVPAIELPWWNTRTDGMEIARLPQHVLKVTPSHETKREPDEPGVEQLPQPEARGDARTSAPAPEPTAANGGVWLCIAVVMALGWAVTGLLWWHHRRSSAKRSLDSDAQVQVREASALKAVKRACGAGDPQRAKDALLQWGRARWPEAAPASLGEIGARLGLGVQAETERLNRILYGGNGENWSGMPLWQALESSLKKLPLRSAEPKSKLEPLFRT